MSHMVIYRGPDSKVGYHQTDDVHDAVSFVEQLRNDQGVEHARIFRLEEVTFEYRPYYRVELRSGPAIGSGDAQPAVEAIASESTATPVPEEAAAKVAEADPVVDTTPAAEPVTAAATKVETVVETKVEETVPSTKDSNNGVGARRGLFGR